MKFLALSLACLWCGLALAQMTSKMDRRLEMVRGKYEDSWKNCSIEMREISDDYDSSEAEGGKCMIACILRKASILNGEEFSRRAMDKIASFVFQDQPEFESLAHRVHLNCEKKLAALKLTDECEIGTRIQLCLQKGWKQVGFKQWTTKWRN